MGTLVPPAVLASPGDLPEPPKDALHPDHHTMFDGSTPWWRPGPSDIIRAIRWWWLVLLPTIVIAVAMPLLVILFPGSLWARSGVPLVKLELFLLGVIFSIVVYGVRNVVTSRRGPFCIHCGYSLEGLDDHGLCPECGRPFIFAVIDEYRRDPHFFIERHKGVKTLPAKQARFAAGDGPTPDDGAS